MTKQDTNLATPNPDHIHTIDVEIVNRTESIASDNEFVPDLPAVNLPLNSNVTTIQQNLLML